MMFATKVRGVRNSLAIATVVNPIKSLVPTHLAVAWPRGERFSQRPSAVADGFVEADRLGPFALVDLAVGPLPLRPAEMFPLPICAAVVELPVGE